MKKCGRKQNYKVESGLDMDYAESEEGVLL